MADGLSRRTFFRWGGSASVVGALPAIPGPSAESAEAEEHGNIGAPTELRVEYAREPLGIDERRPRFSWLVGCRAQHAYQIRVASSVAALSQSGELVWDSGRVPSADSVQIEYGGPELRSRARYHWQVRIWDEQERPSRWSTSWWEMGLLNRADWRAAWIGGRPNPDHDWGDAETTFEFTMTGTALDFLFRARPIGDVYGECYIWRITEEAGTPTLVEQVRQYHGGGGPDTTTTTVLKRVPLIGIPAGELRGRRHRLAIDARGDRIATRMDGVLVDTIVDGRQRSGTIGVNAPESDSGVLHEVSVRTGDETEAFRTDFANNANPFTGGTVTDAGLAVGAGVQQLDLVVPIASPAPLVRKDFSVWRPIRTARLYLAAAGYATFTLNGHQVNQSALDVGYTGYNKRVLYRCYDVTRWIGQGGNTMAAELGRGWYGLVDPTKFYWHEAPWHANPALLAQLEILFGDGDRLLVGTDGSWRAMDGPTTYDSVYSGESHDARLEPAGWRHHGFKDGSWQRAWVVDGPAGALVAAAHEPVQPVEVIKPNTLREAKPGVWVFGFPRIFAGWVRLSVSGPAGTTVSLVHSEKLAADGTVDVTTAPLVDAQLQTDQYTLAGRAKEIWEPRFNFKGFQYVQVEGLPATPSLDTVEGVVAHSSVASAGMFRSSNDLINRIQQAARNSILDNLHGLQTDTPTYEKSGWTGDAQASALATATNFDIARIWTKWLGDFRDALSEEGEIPEIVPSNSTSGYDGGPGWQPTWGPTPSWDSAAVVLPWVLYQHFGDRRVLHRMYETQRRLLHYTGGYITADNDYRYSPFLGDFAGTGPYGPSDATAVAYYFHMLDTVAKSAELLGKPADAAELRTLSDRVRTAYNARYWDPVNRRYRTVSDDGGEQEYAQTQNALPLAFGMVPDGNEKAVAASLNADLVARGHRLTAGIHGTKYLMTLLSDHGYTETAYAVATRTTEPSWGYWVVNGFATMLEHWGLSSRSYNHHFWSSVSSWFYQGLAGIRPAEPGYRSVLIRPAVPTGLRAAWATIDTVRGRVESRWRQDEGTLTLTVRIPPNTSGQVWVPTIDPSTVEAPEEWELVHTSPGRVSYLAGPGNYTVRSRLG